MGGTIRDDAAKRAGFRNEEKTPARKVAHSTGKAALPFRSQAPTAKNTSGGYARGIERERQGGGGKRCTGSEKG